MKKQYSFFIAFVFVLISSLVQAQSQPAFWQVSKGETTVYLMGSMHYGLDNFYPLPVEVESAFKNSEMLVVEVDLTAIAPASAMQAIFKYAGFPPGKTLKDSLSPAVYAALDAHGKKTNLPVSAFNQFQPWFVALQLVEAELKKTAFKPELGIDLHFLQRGGKKIEQLETLDFQLGLFASFSSSEQEAFLDQTLKDLTDSEKYLTAMADAWRTGDIKMMQEQLLEPFKQDKRTKNIYHGLITKRNIKMAAAIKQYLKRPQDVFFVVGAAHMIGSDGIVALLNKQGYKVKRVSFTQKQKGYL